MARLLRPFVGWYRYGRSDVDAAEWKLWATRRSRHGGR